MKLIDLSARIRPDPPDDPEPLRTEIQFDDHAQGAATIGTLFGSGPSCCGTGRAGRDVPPFRHAQLDARRRPERHFADDGESGLAYRAVVEYVPRDGLRGLFDRVIFRRALDRAVRTTLANLDARFAERDASSEPAGIQYA